jgi:hypothetical protein
LSITEPTTVLLRVFPQSLQQLFKIGHDGFFPHPSQMIFYNHNVQRYVNYEVDKVSLNKKEINDEKIVKSWENNDPSLKGQEGVKRHSFFSATD